MLTSRIRSEERIEALRVEFDMMISIVKTIVPYLEKLAKCPEIVGKLGSLVSPAL